MKAIHGGKTKNDRIDSAKIATLLKGEKAWQGKSAVCFSVQIGACCLFCIKKKEGI